MAIGTCGAVEKENLYFWKVMKKIAEKSLPGIVYKIIFLRKKIAKVF